MYHRLWIVLALCFTMVTLDGRVGSAAIKTAVYCNERTDTNICFQKIP